MVNLILHYSRKGENYWADDIKVHEKGLSIAGNRAAQSKDKAQGWAKKFA